MARRNKFTSSGLGEKYSGKTLRVINPDGSFNVIKKGGKPHNIYQYLITTTWVQFFAIALVMFVLINLFFATLIYAAGMENIGGMPTVEKDFWNAFFFCVQTTTTVGYGALFPKGPITNIIASLAAFVGLMHFAIFTGLLYGRFSRPSVNIRFSKKVAIVQGPDHPELHFQIANNKRNIINHPSVMVILKLGEGESQRRHFYNLTLRINKIVFFPLNWRIVHEIDENSPLKGLTLEELKKREAELMIHFEGFDEHYNQPVYTRFGYVSKDFTDSMKFTLAYSNTEQGHTLFDLDDIDKMEEVEKVKM